LRYRVPEYAGTNAYDPQNALAPVSAPSVNEAKIKSLKRNRIRTARVTQWGKNGCVSE